MIKKQKEIDLIKVWIVLKDSKKQVGITTLVTTLVAVVYCVIATPIYTAKLLINPPKLSDAGSGISQALGGLSILAGGGGGLLSQKTDADVTIAILKTSALSDLIIKKYDLQQLYKKDNLELTRGTLNSQVKFIPDMKSGFVEIDVDNKDPQLATNIANYYAIALGQMISNISYGKSNAKAQFYGEQLNVAKKNLDQAENAIKSFAESNGFTAGNQVEIAAGLATQLQAKLIVAQSELQNMSMYATSENPDYIKLQSQIDSYKAQLDNVNANSQNDSIGVPSSVAPKLAKDYASLKREVVLRQEIYALIQKQYEANKLDALSEMAPVGIQVVDPAQVPIYKSAPKRLKIVVGGFMLGLFASSIFFILINRKSIIVEVESEK
jgi:uncharacterized protein involved in exopolysaccharide biosynthesis